MFVIGLYVGLMYRVVKMTELITIVWFLMNTFLPMRIGERRNTKWLKLFFHIFFELFVQVIFFCVFGHFCLILKGLWPHSTFSQNFSFHRTCLQLSRKRIRLYYVEFAFKNNLIDRCCWIHCHMIIRLSFRTILISFAPRPFFMSLLSILCLFS